jgi:hypothetical protein
VKKTYRFKIKLDGDDKARVYRTDGVPTHCASLQVDYYAWEKHTKYNGYNGWRGYVSENTLKAGLANYNPDNLEA